MNSNINDKHNPIIGALSAAMDLAGTDLRTNDRGQKLDYAGNAPRLNFICTIIHRNLFEPTIGKRGTFPSMKEQMDEAQLKLDKFIDRANVLGGGDSEIMNDPQAQAASIRADMTQANYLGWLEIYELFTDAYQAVTGEPYKFEKVQAVVDETTKARASKSLAAAIEARKASAAAA